MKRTALLNRHLSALVAELGHLDEITVADAGLPVPDGVRVIDLAVVAGLRDLAPRLIVTGGGGYNPWTVARLWTLLWADLSGAPVPDALPDAASAVLAALGWQGGMRPPPSRDLLIQLRDAPREGPVRPEIWDRLARLAAR